MAAARAVQIIPHSPIAFTYSRCRRLHQELRQKILDYRAAPRNSLPPPKPTFLAVEPAPTFLLGSSAAKYDPSETTGSLAERFWYGIWDRRGDFYDKKNPYRLGTAQSVVLRTPLDIYSLRTEEHLEAAEGGRLEARCHGFHLQRRGCKAS